MKRTFFTACVGLALVVALFTGVFAVMGWGSLLSQVGSAVLYPFRWVTAKIGDAAAGFGAYFDDMAELRAELESLKEENESLRGELVDAEIIADESAWLYRYLSIKEEHEDYEFCAATVISTTTAEGAGSAYATELTLNKGTSSGVSAGMPVITTAGLVGVVVEAGVYHCRVTTVLDPTISVGAVTTRASENGLCEGAYAHIQDGQAVLRYLPEEADVAAGDIVVTSGRGSVYPYGIPIGRVIEVSANAYSRTTEAILTPFVDFSELSQVVILTAYTHYVDGYEASDANGGSS